MRPLGSLWGEFPLAPAQWWEPMGIHPIVAIYSLPYLSNPSNPLLVGVEPVPYIIISIPTIPPITLWSFHCGIDVWYVLKFSVLSIPWITAVKHLSALAR